MPRTMAENGGRSGGSFRERARVWHDRRGLLKGTRHLVFLSVLVLQKRTEDIRECMHWALERRVPVGRIREAVLQSHLFAGFPRALHALEILDEVLLQRGVTEAPAKDRIPPRVSVRAWLRRRGRELFREVYREDAELVIDRIAAFHPDFMDWILEDAYGKVLARPFLDLKTREILAVAMLTALDLPRQLTPHLRAALRAGARVRELSEAIRQLGLLIPRDRVNRALVRLERARTSL